MLTKTMILQIRSGYTIGSRAVYVTADGVTFKPELALRTEVPRVGRTPSKAIVSRLMSYHRGRINETMVKPVKYTEKEACDNCRNSTSEASANGSVGVLL